MQVKLLPWLADPAALAPFLQTIHSHYRDAACAYLTSPRLGEDLPSLLASLHHTAHQLITPLFVGAPVEVPTNVIFEWTLDLKTGTLQKRRLSANEWAAQYLLDTRQEVRFGAVALEDRFFFELVDFIEHSKRFPFAWCIVCHNYFLRPERGRRPLFCSIRCKGKGVPSAARRTEYMRDYRHQKRAEELHLARLILRKRKTEVEQVVELGTQLPHKSRRALVQLLRQVQRIKAKRNKTTQPTRRKEV